MRSSSFHRFLDRAGGVPLVHIGAALRHRRPLPETAGRVVILQPTAIGDAIMTSGVPAAVRRSYPDVQIDLLHGQSNAAALALVDADMRLTRLDFRRPDRVVRAIRERKPDVVIDLTPWPRLTALCAMLSGAVTVGYDSAGQSRGAAFDITAPHLGNRHELDNVRELAAIFDPFGPYRPALKQPTKAPSADLPYERLILFHTTCGGSRRLDRTWDPHKWVNLAGRLSRDGFVIGFSGTSSEVVEIQPTAELASKVAETILLAGRLNFDEFAYVLSHACAIVSLDTGAIHLASALDARVVGLYGPARASRWGPWSSRCVGVDSPHPSAGYSIFGFETSPSASAIMDAITVDMVYDAVTSLLK